MSFVFLQLTSFGQAPKDTAYVKDIYFDLENKLQSFTEKTLSRVGKLKVN